MSPIAALRREAGLSRAECARAMRLTEASYARFERGELPERRRDLVALCVPLARLLAQRLGRPVSAQWDLCGHAQPITGSNGRAAAPSGKRGRSGSCALAARPDAA